MLRQVAERLAATVRAEDTVARLGGDEFVVLQTNVAHASEAEGYRCFELVRSRAFASLKPGRMVSARP